VRVAAAVLGAALLFFLGVLTGTGRRESAPPPMAIPLGIVDAPDGAAADGAATSPITADPSEPAPARGGSTPTTAAPGSPSPTTAPTATPNTAATPAPTTPPAPTPATTAPATTSTTARPGQVEEVDSEVECSRGRKGKGGREPCATTTTAERDGGRSGGGGIR
jgi:hypothetical protein